MDKNLIFGFLKHSLETAFKQTAQFDHNTILFFTGATRTALEKPAFHPK
ncbi:MAG: hypothetical protein WC989_02740 [Micavibrio sp.]